MKKFLVSSTFVVLFAAYVFYTNLTSAPATLATPTTAEQRTGTVPVVTTSTAAAAPPAKSTAATTKTTTPNPTVAPVIKKSAGQYTDGTYTGAAEDAFYGTVQVQAVISNGALANVQILQYPSDQGTSRYINQQAMPMLVSEAIQAQSANVNGVSGASHSSEAFKQSLATALSQAKA